MYPSIQREIKLGGDMPWHGVGGCYWEGGKCIRQVLVDKISVTDQLAIYYAQIFSINFIMIFLVPFQFIFKVIYFQFIKFKLLKIILFSKKIFRKKPVKLILFSIFQRVKIDIKNI